MHGVLERLLHDESAEPRKLPLSLLRAITNNFDNARIIGEDVLSTVYQVPYVSLQTTTLCFGLLIVCFKAAVNVMEGCASKWKSPCEEAGSIARNE
jgi:hypothetical protein